MWSSKGAAESREDAGLAVGGSDQGACVRILVRMVGDQRAADSGE